MTAFAVGLCGAVATSAAVAVVAWQCRLRDQLGRGQGHHGVRWARARIAGRRRLAPAPGECALREDARLWYSADQERLVDVPQAPVMRARILVKALMPELREPAAGVVETESRERAATDSVPEAAAERS
jgi:hypothetical protein